MTGYTIRVADGYNGATVVLSTRILDEVGHFVKLRVVGSEYLIRWVSCDEYNRKLALAQEQDDREPFSNGPDTNF